MQLYFNADSHARVWPTQTNPQTGTTLELAVGQEIELDLPADFEDAFLKPVPHQAAAAAHPAKRPNGAAPTDNEAAPVADTEKE